MPVYDEKRRAALSQHLVSVIERAVTKFCFENGICRGDVPKILDAPALNSLAQDLGFEVETVSSDSILFGMGLIRNYPYSQK